MLANLLNRTQCRLKVAHIIHGIEHPEHINTIDGSAFYKLFNHIIGVVAVAKNILTAKKHLLWRIGHGLFNFTNTIPGVFTEKTNTGIKGSTTPGFH